MLTHCIGYQRILDVDLPLGLILSDVVKYIGGVTDSDGYGISCLTAGVEDPVAQLLCHTCLGHLLEQTAVLYCGSILCILLAQFCEAVLGSCTVLPLLQDLFTGLILGGNDHTYICGRSLIQISLLKCHGIVAMAVVVSNDGGVSCLSGIIKQPVGDQVVHGRLLLILVCFAVFCHGLLRIVSQYLGIFHGLGDLSIGRLVSGILCAVSSCGSIGGTCGIGSSLLYGICQFGRLSGQISFDRGQAVIYGIVGCLIFLIIALDLIITGSIVLLQLLIISVHYHVVLHIFFDTAHGCIASVDGTYIFLLGDACGCSGGFDGLLESIVLIRGIVGEAGCFGFCHQRLILLQALYSILLKIVLPGQSIGIHLGGQILAGIQSEVCQIAAVLGDIIVLGQVVLVIELYLVYSFSIDHHIGLMSCQIGTNGERCYQTYQSHKHYDANGRADALFLFLLFLLLFTLLYLTVIFGHDLLFCLFFIFCNFFILRHCLHVSFLVS